MSSAIPIISSCDIGACPLETSATSEEDEEEGRNNVNLRYLQDTELEVFDSNDENTTTIDESSIDPDQTFLQKRNLD